MGLSNYPSFLLIQDANVSEREVSTEFENWIEYIDHELDLRQPNEAASYFGDCAGKAIFIPVEPEYDSTGQPILTKVIGHDEQGEIWL